MDLDLQIEYGPQTFQYIFKITKIIVFFLKLFAVTKNLYI